MTEEDERKVWPFNSVFGSTPEPFPLLARDRGPIGQILRGFSEAIFPGNGKELLREAARCETDGEDPWQFLLGIRGVAREDAQLFKAAQSQRRAWRQLLDRCHGWGDLRERCEKLRNAPHGTPIQPCQRQLFSRMWRVERWAMLDDPKLSDEMRAEFKRMGKEEDRKLVKRFGHKSLDQPDSLRSIDHDKLSYMLVRAWVRCGKGPGLMFFSSRAMTHYIFELHSWSRWMDRVEQVKKARRRMGLVLADEDNPFITSVTFQHALSIIKGEGRHGFEFQGQIRICGQSLFPRKRS